MRVYFLLFVAVFVCIVCRVVADERNYAVTFVNKQKIMSVLAAGAGGAALMFVCLQETRVCVERRHHHSPSGGEATTTTDRPGDPPSIQGLL